jgi:hypothetical protein
MRFRDCIRSDAEWAAYERVLTQLSSFLDGCVTFLLGAHQLADERGAKDDELYHATITLLTRHVCDFIDGISILAKKGAGEPCKPLLRSAYEATISVYYILAKDTRQRALAYQIVHAHKRINLYRKMIPTEPSGKDLRQRIQSDALGDIDVLPTLHCQKMIDKLNHLLLDSRYAGIEQAWQNAKKRTGRNPQWFSLFDGPSNIRDLAKAAGFPALYEFLYWHWSDAVHAGGVLDNIYRGENGCTVLRPLRHPEGVQTAVNLAAGICTSLARRLVQYYVPDRVEEFNLRYTSEVRDRYLALSKLELIKAPWK